MCCVVKYWIYIFVTEITVFAVANISYQMLCQVKKHHSLSYVKERLFKDVSSGQRFHKTSQILKFRAIIFIVKLLLSDVPFQGDSI